MGSTCGIVIEGTSANAVIEHLSKRHPEMEVHPEPCDYHDAERLHAIGLATGSRAAVADVAADGRRWTELWDGDYEGFLVPYLDKPPIDLPLGSRALAFLLDGTRCCAGFWYYVDGALVRSVYDCDGQPSRTTGAPLVAEAGLDQTVELPEDYVSEVMSSLGFRMVRSPPAHEGVQYRVLERWSDGSSPWTKKVSDRSPTVKTLTSEEEARLRVAFGIAPAGPRPRRPRAKARVKPRDRGAK